MIHTLLISHKPLRPGTCIYHYFLHINMYLDFTGYALGKLISVQRFQANGLYLHNKILNSILKFAQHICKIDRRAYSYSFSF